MTDKPLLSDLCRICNNNIPKYCCPRCRCLTCSLPCYKRHQKWSQCSGKRDPAAFMKRSQLLTPAGIDHDYNFLTGIERAFDNADRDAEARSISLESKTGRENLRLQRLEQRIRDTKVIVRRAPKGMSRQKENQTQCLNARGQESLSWTVEWILPDGSRKVKNCAEKTSILGAYETLHRDKTATKSNKRKRGYRTGHLRHEIEAQKAVEAEHFASENAPEAGAEAPEASNGLATPFKGEIPKSKELHGYSQPETTTLDIGRQASPRSKTSHSSTNEATENEANRNRDTGAESASSHPEELNQYFYLHRPLCSSSSRVLIPLSQNATLLDSLANRTVLEFPTIHVLHEAPGSLPQGFQLESDYIVETRKMIKELDDELKPFMSNDIGGWDEDQAPGEAEREAFDESKVLETLKKDVASLEWNSVT